MSLFVFNLRDEQAELEASINRYIYYYVCQLVKNIIGPIFCVYAYTDLTIILFAVNMNNMTCQNFTFPLLSLKPIIV